MFTFQLTNAKVCRKSQDDNTPNITFTTYEDGGMTARVNICVSKYDKKAENNYRSIYYTANFSGSVAKKLQQMNLQIGSKVNLSGDIDQRVWIGNDGVKHTDTILIVRSIEYAASGSSHRSDEQNQGSYQAQPAAAPQYSGYQQATPQPVRQQQPNGYRQQQAGGYTSQPQQGGIPQPQPAAVSAPNNWGSAPNNYDGYYQGTVDFADEASQFYQS